jgi:hypothetical protein
MMMIMTYCYLLIIITLILLYQIQLVSSQQAQVLLPTRVAKVIQTCNGNADYMLTQSNYMVQLRGYLHDEGCTDRLVQKYVIDMSRRLANGLTPSNILTRLQFIVDMKQPTTITSQNLVRWAGFVTSFDTAVTNAIKARG